MVDVYPCINIFYYLCGVNSNLYFMDKYIQAVNQMLASLDYIKRGLNPMFCKEGFKHFSSKNPDIHELLLFFIHLVYQYDHQFPLNYILIEFYQRTKKMDHTHISNELEKYMEFFKSWLTINL